MSENLVTEKTSFAHMSAHSALSWRNIAHLIPCQWNRLKMKKLRKEIPLDGMISYLFIWVSGLKPTWSILMSMVMLYINMARQSQ